MQKTFTAFENAIDKAARAYITQARAEGTTGMSVDNLMQVVRAPSEMLPGAPRGTNARYYYCEAFRGVCAADPVIRAFLIQPARGRNDDPGLD